ncbi:hypothetical protein, partial [Candidatus Borrarchaeum sp.]|uniref:hypothetical protein n=1 Tax=Candidatus Borrarchaeum sp. TaxID=2846742 RepID=UPI00257B8A60
MVDLNQKIWRFLKSRSILFGLVFLSFYTLTSRLRLALSYGHLFLEDAYNLGNAANQIYISGYWDPAVLSYVPGMPLLISILKLITGLSVLNTCRYFISPIAAITIFPTFALSRRILKRDKESFVATYFFVITLGYFNYSRILIPAPIGFLLIFLSLFLILQFKIPITKSLGLISILGGALFITHQLSFYVLFLILLTVGVMNYAFHRFNREAKLSLLALFTVFIGAAPFWLVLLPTLGFGVFGGTGMGWGNLAAVYGYIRTPETLFYSFGNILNKYSIIWGAWNAGIPRNSLLSLILIGLSQFS